MRSAIAASMVLALFFASGCKTAKVGDLGSSSSSSTSSHSSSTGHASSTGGTSAGTTGSGSGSTTTNASSSTTTSTSASGSTGTTSGSSTSTSSGSTGSLTLGPSIDALVGINGFIDDPANDLAAFGTLREYHDWTWNDGNGAAGYPGYPNNQLSFSLFSGYWDFDAYYEGLTDAGVTIFPCVQGSVDYLNNALPPVTVAGADPTLAASYTAHADFMFQYAARYGSVVVPDAKLKLASGQVRVSGLNVLHLYEDGNEPDNNWTNSDGSHLFSPAAYAAMASADYDGDQGRLGNTFGIKNADPNARMVMAGLAMAGPSDAASNAKSYLDGIRTWATANRGGSFPADIINLHQYCFGPDPFGTTNPRPGISPEDCGLGAMMAEMVAYKNQNLPSKELWITEFGYDTDPGSRLRAPAIGNNSAGVVQGQWLVRTILAVAEAGVDRATLFVSRDGCSSPTCNGHDVQFTTSGVITDSTSSFTPKPAFFFLSAFRKALAGLHFVGPRSSGRSDVKIDAFADATGKGAYVVWTPTSTANVISGYSLSMPGASHATEVQLVDQSLTGTSSALTLSAGAATVDVSETPLVVQVDHVQ